MRRSVVLAILMIGLAGAALLFLRTSREETFDERFERADQRLEDMAQSIEEDLEEAQAQR